MRGLRGRVVLIDFWTYTCINCIRTQPHLKAWDSRYRDDGPDDHRRPLARVRVRAGRRQRRATRSRETGLSTRSAQDNDYGTWNASANQYWPAKYLIDARGHVRYAHFGEGDYDETERAIRALLREAGAERRTRTRRRGAGADAPSPGVTTPETYLGCGARPGLRQDPIGPGRDFGSARACARRPTGFAYRGRWRLERERAVAGTGARLALHVGARRVFLVLGSPGRTRRVRVLMDGGPCPTGSPGRTCTVAWSRSARSGSTGSSTSARSSGRWSRSSFEPGVAGYAFTFG